MAEKKTICPDCLNKVKAYDDVNKGELKLVPKSKVCSFCIEMCKEFDVWHHPHIPSMTHPICQKTRYWMAGVKCHSKREDCPDYAPQDRIPG